MKILPVILMSFITFSAEAKLKITSQTFVHNGTLPTDYTCDGKNVSPPLQWSHVPHGTKSLVILVHDPDVPLDRNPKGVLDHWVVYNLPATTKELPENVTSFPEGTKIGINSRNAQAFRGACPPDKTHRYIFRLYAIDTTLKFDKPPTREQVEAAIKGHILEEAEITGLYNRPQNEKK